MIDTQGDATGGVIISWVVSGVSVSTDRNRRYAGLYLSLHDEGSPALPGDEQAIIDQDAHRLDHGGPADTVRRGQLGHARDLVTARPLCGLDLAPDLSGQPLAGKLG
jgi:hypothetical protein